MATGQARANRYRPIVAEAHLPDGDLPGSARQVLVLQSSFSGDLRREALDLSVRIDS